MMPQPLEYARTDETRRDQRQMRRPATDLDFAYSMIVLLCYLLALGAMLVPPVRASEHGWRYMTNPYATYAFGATAVLSIYLSLIGFRGIIREGQSRCPASMLICTVLSGGLAFFTIEHLGAWFKLVSDSFHLLFYGAVWY